MSTFRRIPVEELHFDSRNPRIPQSLRQEDETKTLNYLVLESATAELMQAIGENGFFEGEMLLVAERGDGGYTVVEGNRRLCAVMLLNDPGLTSRKKETVRTIAASSRAQLPIAELPCLVFQSKSEITKYLGFVHVTGKQPWGLLQKAEYLHNLYCECKTNNFDEDTRAIAKTIGGKSKRRRFY